MTFSSLPVSSTGLFLDGTIVASTNVYRETVVISDAVDRNAVAPVSSTVGMSVNLASSIALLLGAAIGISSIPAVGVSSIPGLNVSSFTAGSIGVSSVASHNVTMSSGVGVSSIPALNVSSFAGAFGQSTMAFSIPVTLASNQNPVSIAGVGISSMPAVNVSSFTAGSIGVSSLPATLPGVNVSSFTAGSVGISSIPAVGISSIAGVVGQTTIAFSVPVTIATNQSALPVSAVGVSSMPVIGVSSMAGGAMSIGVSSVASHNVTMSSGIGVSSNPAMVQTASSTGGGLSVSLLKANLNTTNSTVAKAGPGQLYGYEWSNTSTQAYLRFFNASSAVQISTAAQTLQIAMTASSAARMFYNPPITFSTGIYYATTLLQASGDNTVIAASTVTINVIYA